MHTHAENIGFAPFTIMAIHVDEFSLFTTKVDIPDGELDFSTYVSKTLRESIWSWGGHVVGTTLFPALAVWPSVAPDTRAWKAALDIIGNETIVVANPCVALHHGECIYAFHGDNYDDVLGDPVNVAAKYLYDVRNLPLHIASSWPPGEIIAGMETIVNQEGLITVSVNVGRGNGEAEKKL